MKLNRVEKALMNNPVRAAVQRGYEARLLQRLGGTLFGGRALEIGCGRGVGVGIIYDVFGARYVDAFDLDPDMVQRARRRLGAREHLNLWVGSATEIQAPDKHYDAVFDFGIVHHIPDWRMALDEVARVLKPGGRFFFEEVTAQALERRIYRVLFDHPDRDRFSAVQFAHELSNRGIDVDHRLVERFFGDFVIGVGERIEDPDIA